MARGHSHTKDIDLGYKRAVSTLEFFAHVGIEAGVFEDAGTYADGTPYLVVANAHEYGVPSLGIPERSFIRRAFDANEERYVRLLDQYTSEAMAGFMSPEQVVEALGKAMKRDIQLAIDAINRPALQPETVARKGSSKPLKDSLQLRNEAVQYKIED